MSLHIIDSHTLYENITLSAELITLTEKAYITMTHAEVIIPEIHQIPVTAVNGQLCVKSAYSPQAPYFVVKMAGGFPQNRETNIQTTQGCMCLFNAKTGELDTILADNGWLTQLRTAASGALVAKLFAPDTVNKVTVIGAGVQAKLQLQALALVRQFQEVIIYDRTNERANKLANWAIDVLGVKTTVANSVEDAVKEAEVIITATSAQSPFLSASMLDLTKPIHITAMGSDSPDKSELFPDIFHRASRFVCDSQSQSLKLGELRPLKDQAVTDFSKAEELSNVCLHQNKRQASDKLTVCDLTGVGILDLAIATYAKTLLH